MRRAEIISIAACIVGEPHRRDQVTCAPNAWITLVLDPAARRAYARSIGDETACAFGGAVFPTQEAMLEGNPAAISDAASACACPRCVPESDAEFD